MKRFFTVNFFISLILAAVVMFVSSRGDFLDGGYTRMIACNYFGWSLVLLVLSLCNLFKMDDKRILFRTMRFSLLTVNLFVMAVLMFFVHEFLEDNQWLYVIFAFVDAVTLLFLVLKINRDAKKFF